MIRNAHKTSWTRRRGCKLVAHGQVHQIHLAPKYTCVHTHLNKHLKSVITNAFSQRMACPKWNINSVHSYTHGHLFMEMNYTREYLVLFSIGE